MNSSCPRMKITFCLFSWKDQRGVKKEKKKILQQCFQTQEPKSHLGELAKYCLGSS